MHPPPRKGKIQVGRVAVKGFVGCTRHPPVFILKIDPMAMNPLPQRTASCRSANRHQRGIRFATGPRCGFRIRAECFLVILTPGEASCFPAGILAESVGDSVPMS